MSVNEAQFIRGVRDCRNQSAPPANDEERAAAEAHDDGADYAHYLELKERFEP